MMDILFTAIHYVLISTILFYELENLSLEGWYCLQ